MTVIVPGSEDYNRIVNRFPFGGGYDGGGINPGNMYGGGSNTGGNPMISDMRYRGPYDLSLIHI